MSDIVKVDGEKDNAKTAKFEVIVKKNGVVYFELNRREFTPDRGYDYDRAVNFH